MLDYRRGINGYCLVDSFEIPLSTPQQTFTSIGVTLPDLWASNGKSNLDILVIAQQTIGQISSYRLAQVG